MSPVERLIMQHLARQWERKGVEWVAYGVPTTSVDGQLVQPWSWHDYKPLVARGLLERQEDWKNVYLRITNAGWRALSTTDASGLPKRGEKP
jgi:hypothetical protein